MKQAWELLKQTVSEWIEDKVPRLSAALAYYTIFAIAPLLLIAVSIAGLIFTNARSSVIAQLNSFLGKEAADAIEGIMNNASLSGGGIAAIIGVVTLLIGATGVFGQLKDALNTIWEVAPKPGRGIMGIVKDRFLSLTMVLGIGFLLLVSLVISAALDSLKEYVFGSELGILFQVLNFIVSIGVVTLLFAMIFKILPDVEISWNDVWLGAAATALLFTLGKFLISLYISNSSTASAYGAAGSLIIILLWVYYSAIILFFGAEFTQVYANRYGSHVVPSDQAVAVTEEMRAQEGMPRTEDVEDAAEGRRTPRPDWRKGKTPTPQVVTINKIKSLEKQRYVAMLAGFLGAVLLGGVRSLKDQPAPANDRSSDNAGT